METYFYAIFNLALIGIRQKKRQIKNHAKLTSYTVSIEYYTSWNSAFPYLQLRISLTEIFLPTCDAACQGKEKPEC